MSVVIMAVVIHNSRHANNLPSGGEAAGSLGQISEDPCRLNQLQRDGVQADFTGRVYAGPYYGRSSMD